MITVRHVQNDGDLEIFLGFNSHIYREKYQLRQKFIEEFGIFQQSLHPALEHVRYALYLALENDNPVGRVAALIDEQYLDDGAGFFGCFEAQNSPAAVELLINACAGWLKSMGKTVMYGPVTLTTSEKVGVLVEGFDAPLQHMIPFNPPYYAGLLEKAGLVKEIDLVSYRPVPGEANLAQVEKIADRARNKQSGLVLRSVDYGCPQKEQVLVREVLNRSLSANWGFAPLTEREVEAFIMDMTLFVDPRLFLLAEMSGRPAGICLTIPRFNPMIISGQGNKPDMRVALLGVVPEFRLRGLEAVLIQKTVATIQEIGFNQVELSMIAENNVMMQRIARSIGNCIARRCRVYRLNLTA